MYGKLGYPTLSQVAYWNCTCEVVRGSPLLPALLAAVLAGGGSLLSAGFIIWAMSGWFCFSRRIRVISRVNAAGSSTNAFASASGLSRTMAMSIAQKAQTGAPVATNTHSCTISASYEVSQAQKAKRRKPYCYCHIQLKELALYRKSLMRRYHYALMMSTISHTMKTTCKSTSALELSANRSSHNADARKSTDRTLSAP